MVTKVEVNGYEIVIEEKDGVISVSAMKDDEVVEEFELETEEGQGFDDEEGEDVQGFDEFGQDEEDDFDAQGQDDEDFDSQDDEEVQDDEDFDSQDEEEDDKFEGQLESFQSFINKRK